MNTRRRLTALGLFAAACASGQDGLAPEARAGAARAALVNFNAKELVGRPTDDSITLKAIGDRATEAYVEYGTLSGALSETTPRTAFTTGVIQIELGGLAANTRYYYRLRYRENGSSDAFSTGNEFSFVTQRAPSETFTFAIQSDSHQGFAAFYSDALYGVTLDNILRDQPDFLFDLGDTISTDDATETLASVRTKYREQRAMFDLLGHSTPVFLVLGNHENEEGWNLDDKGANVATSLPVMGANMRKRFFLNPVPDGFYSGNDEPLPEIDGDHLRGDYYAFTWGSALFVAIDPFWYTMKKPYAGTTGGEKDDEEVGDRWDWTLGKRQYDWLRETLEGSDARFKFVFAHHLTGGTSDYGRAGALGAKYGEWGGYNPDGTTYAFDDERPGWGKPIHELLVENHVTAFFHGHDHVYARETLDGVVYQACPHAANDDYGSGFATNASDYASAVRVNNSGHLRVTVSPAAVSVSYVRAFLAGDGTNRSIGDSYTLECSGAQCNASEPPPGEGGSAGAGGSGELPDVPIDAGSGGAVVEPEPTPEGGEGGVRGAPEGSAGTPPVASDGGESSGGVASAAGGKTSMPDAGAPDAAPEGGTGSEQPANPTPGGGRRATDPPATGKGGGGSGGTPEKPAPPSGGTGPARSSSGGCAYAGFQDLEGSPAGLLGLVGLAWLSRRRRPHGSAS